MDQNLPDYFGCKYASGFIIGLPEERKAFWPHRHSLCSSSPTLDGSSALNFKHWAHRGDFLDNPKLSLIGSFFGSIFQIPAWAFRMGTFLALDVELAIAIKILILQIKGKKISLFSWLSRNDTIRVSVSNSSESGSAPFQAKKRQKAPQIFFFKNTTFW